MITIIHLPVPVVFHWYSYKSCTFPRVSNGEEGRFGLLLNVLGPREVRQSEIQGGSNMTGTICV